MKKCMRSYFPYLVTIAVLVLFPLMCLGQVAQTFRQVEHSKLFANYGLRGHRLTEGQGDGGFAGDAHIPLQLTLPQRSALFSKLACQSDAVVVGKIIDQTGLLSPDETFIFTDADLSVVETLKDNPGSHIFPNQTIVVTREGGSLQFNGRKLAVKLNHFKDFSVGGQYLLFLKFLPTTMDYEAFWDRTFELRNGLILNLSNYALWEGQQSGKQDASTALADARAAVGTPCK